MSETVEKHYGKSWDALIRKSFCITDLIRFLRSTRAGFISTLLSRHTFAQAVPDNVMVMLTDFGLSKLKSTEQKSQHKNTRDMILNGIDWDSIERNCFQIDVYDNMGHRR